MAGAVPRLLFAVPVHIATHVRADAADGMERSLRVPRQGDLPVVEDFPFTVAEVVVARGHRVPPCRFPATVARGEMGHHYERLKSRTARVFSVSNL